MIHDPEDRRSFRNHVLDLSERFNSLPGRTAEYIVELVAGSNSDAYTQLQWKKSTQTPDTLPDAAWVREPGDPDLGHIKTIFPRNWIRSVVIGAPTEELADLRQRLESVDAVIQPAVAYDSGQKLRIGLLPEGHDFAPVSYGDVPHSAVAARLGRGAYHGTMGYFNHSLGRLWTPSQVVTIETVVLNTELSSFYPGITLT
jgi:hypothetical protein